MNLATLEDLLKDQVQDLYNAENQLVKALPKMAKSASSPGLKQAFEDHLIETKGHVDRLERIASELQFKPTGKTCDAMKGLVEEGGEAIDSSGHPVVHDVNLIAAAQRVEHYEIAAYGTIREIAENLGRTHIADLVEATLEEERAADTKLTEICRNLFNRIPLDKDAVENAPEQVKKDENRDPLSGEHGSHAVGTGVGAATGGIAAGAAAGAAIGTAGGPIGMAAGAAIGAAVGAVAGGYAGHAIAEQVNPTVEHDYWRVNYSTRPYVAKGEAYDNYAAAYQYGWESQAKYKNRKYSDVEMDLEGGWPKARGKSNLSWDRAKEAVRDSWNRIAGKDKTNK